MNLDGLVVLVVGGTSGIGSTLINILHEYGATVVATYHNKKINNELIDTYYCDITSEDSINELMNYIKEKHEKLDVVVNCSAIDIANDIYNKTKDEFMKVLEVNLVGSFLIMKEASKIMSRGVIINLSSTDATDTYNTLSMDYASSKAGVENLVKNMAERLPNLKICALAPNWVDTAAVLEMDPNYLKEEMNRVGQKELIKKENVALKILEIIINDDIRSGDIIRMSGKDE